MDRRLGDALAIAANAQAIPLIARYAILLIARYAILLIARYAALLIARYAALLIARYAILLIARYAALVCVSAEGAALTGIAVCCSICFNERRIAS
ncbi:hypothetical protein Pan216_28100 [Planctomycetes bacterium Pan216]|uniref:Uncharacterized protein n=1 Tax=Kolteria novifilia TaxID=2527975 RepID=A0A518B4P0_9BACT|nr:hypothetical protein Pan216_28100 [Planctomycetes bacterium Pan216]